ncbi:MAG: ThiF family adenylyltransferase [Pirellulaceae bacterium]|nr:ThiF family adenylyltransferase [Pirellulaceae bacterium]
MPEEEFVIDDDDRYSRLRLIAWWDQERLAKSKILVVGAGALGNEVLKNLALLGIGHIYIVDFDEIEESNLTRSVLFRSRDRGRPKAEAAAAALKDLNPDTQVRSMRANIMTEVGLGLFKEVDVVIGCLDNREARLWVNRSCWKVNTPWIDGGIQEINGVAKVFQPPDGACYECAMTETDYRLINLRYSCPLLRQEDLQAGKVPTAPTISSMIGGLQTQEALKLIHGMPVASGEAMVYNGVANQFYRTKFQHREDCLSHETYPEPTALALAAQRTTAQRLFAAAADAFDAAGPWRLILDRDLVVTLECAACDRRDRLHEGGNPFQVIHG